MSDFTQVNLKDDVENASEKFGLAPNMEARFARDAMGLEGGGFSYQKLAPNFRAPFGHHHERQEEVYVVVGGSGRLKVGDDIVDVAQWDAVRVPPELMRALEAGPDGLDVVAVGAPGVPDTQQEMGWWAD